MVFFIDHFFSLSSLTGKILDNFGNFDFDVLQKCGSNSTADFSVGRDSVLLRFDPLLEKLAPVETTNQRLTPTTANTTATRLASTKEEEDENCTEGQSASDNQEDLIPVESFTSPTNCISSLYTSPPLPSNAETSAMKDLDQGNETIESVHETKEQFKDLSLRWEILFIQKVCVWIMCHINHCSYFSYSDNNQQLLQQQEIEFNKKMTELESQLRKEAEMKEEALLKR